MRAITIGTTNWRMTQALAAGEVEFTGDYIFDVDGSPLMVWDPQLNNVRAMTQAEKDARAAQKTAAATDKSDAKAMVAQAVIDINTYLTGADTATATQVRAEVKAIDQRQRAILKALYQLL